MTTEPPFLFSSMPPWFSELYFTVGMIRCSRLFFPRALASAIFFKDPLFVLVEGGILKLRYEYKTGSPCWLM